MSNIIDFPTNISYKVLFTMPSGKVLKMHKSSEDDFEIEIKNNQGVAWVRANGKVNAAARVQKVFPDSKIIEVNPQ